MPVNKSIKMTVSKILLLDNTIFPIFSDHQLVRLISSQRVFSFNNFIFLKTQRTKKFNAGLINKRGVSMTNFIGLGLG